MSNTEGKKIGGFREGSGGKPKHKAGKTTTKRIPEKYIDAVSSLINHLESNAEINKKGETKTSEPLRIVSAFEQEQEITFTIKAV